MGVGILASMAIDPVQHADLVFIDASHLFAPHVAWIGFRRGRLLSGYKYEFRKGFAPHLARRLVDQAVRAGAGPALERLFAGLELPILWMPEPEP